MSWSRRSRYSTSSVNRAGRTVAAFAPDEVRERGGHRFEHESKRAYVDGRDVGRQVVGDHRRGQVRGRRAVHKELVFGEPLAIEVRHRDCGRLGAIAGEGKTVSIRFQQLSQTAA